MSAVAGEIAHADGRIELADTSALESSPLYNEDLAPVPVEVKPIQPGLWRLDPKSDLKPGEYGVWGPGSELYDFGVDK